MKKTRPGSPTLFTAAERRTSAVERGDPLADRMRPRSLAEVAGQQHLVGPNKPLARLVESDRLGSMILWGPPGCGKTSLAQVVANTTKARFVPYSAVLGSVPELRQILAEAQENKQFRGERTILFLDEIHRFNKSQQDALLPHVERGDVVLIGATTENPSFAINAALLSRCRVFALQGLDETELVAVLQSALADTERGLGSLNVSIEEQALMAIARSASGDARRALGLLESVVMSTPDASQITLKTVEEALSHKPLLYDKAGEEHYNVVSAMIKSLRGSDPDAALYWMFRMLDAGDDPLFVSRRLIIFASEDIGNADPRALDVAIAADAAFRRMGMPEGAYPLSHACLYLACAPKSDGVKRAMKAARAAITEYGSLPVPMKLRNAVTNLMKDQGYGSGYQNPHAHQDHIAHGETYLPDEIADSRFYEPTDIGFEKNIKERLDRRRGNQS